MELILDDWQKEVLETKGKHNICLRAGRQVGKSTVISMLAGNYAIENKNSSIMVISATERQAYLLFTKILLYLDDNFKKEIAVGKKRPTKSQINLKNGSIIRCLPTGLDGLGIRGFTINLLIADEAAFIHKEVWPAVVPSLSTTGGKIILLSTPLGSTGYFYDCYHDDSFKTWHINAEDVANCRLEPQKSWMREHQNKQKEIMSQLQYAQEYLGEFVDEFQRMFSDELIRKCCTLKKRESIKPQSEYYLGVDIARMGNDYCSFQILRKINDNNIIHSRSIMAKKQYTTETEDRIRLLHNQYDFRLIGIDAGSGSLGVGIYDQLIRDPILRKRVIAINNQQRNLDAYGKKKKTLQKEDMYFNLQAMLERERIHLLDDDELIQALRAIQYEYNLEQNKKSSIKIFAPHAKYTDLIEGLIRAAWLANQKSKNFNILWV